MVYDSHAEREPFPVLAQLDADDVLEVTGPTAPCHLLPTEAQRQEDRVNPLDWCYDGHA